MVSPSFKLDSDCVLILIVEVESAEETESETAFYKLFLEPRIV